MTIDFCNSERKNTKGSFKPSETQQNDTPEPSFSVFIKLNIQIPIGDIRSERTAIRSVLAHELNHAFVFVHDVNKKTSAMNARRKEVMLSSDKDPGVQMLNKALYLTNPMEIQARIQDIGGLVDDLKSDTAEDALSELMLYQPFMEIVDLNRMDLNTIEITDAVQEFVRQMGGGDVKAFIAALDKTRDSTALKALKKTYRLVADRYSVKENFVLESDAFDRIYEHVPYR